MAKKDTDFSFDFLSGAFIPTAASTACTESQRSHYRLQLIIDTYYTESSVLKITRDLTRHSIAADGLH
jgi:hypothetical protein